MRIASGVVLGLTIALFAAWWFLLRAPGPVQVCDHIIEVTLREASGQDLSDETQRRMIERTRSSCIEHKQDKILLRGRIKYAEYAKCVLGATTLSEIGRC